MNSDFFFTPIEEFQSNYFINVTWVENFQAKNLQDFRIIIIRYTNERSNQNSEEMPTRQKLGHS